MERTPQHITKIKDKLTVLENKVEKGVRLLPYEITMLNTLYRAVVDFDKQEQQQKITDRQKQLQK